MKSTNKHHSRHTSEGSSFPYHSNVAANAVTAVNTTSSIPMTRRHHDDQPHPNRLIPQPPPSSSSTQQPSPSSSPSIMKTSSYQPAAAQDPSRRASSSVQSSPISLSSTTSKTNNNLDNIHLTRISSPSHLTSLPAEFLSNDIERPLLHVDVQSGYTYKYYLNPMKQAVFFILLIEMLERFSFYGINYTTTAYLTGE